MVTRILFVDDEPTIATTLSLIAEQCGYESKAAFSAEAALDMMKSFLPDLLVTDYQMPGMDGIDLAMRVSREFPGCKIFMLTAYLRSSTFKSQKSQSHITFLEKPIHPRELLKLLKQPAIPEALRRSKILSVDDVDSHRYSIARMLRARGFDVDEASSGREALAKVSSGEFDVVLLDVNLPDMDGFEVCGMIRSGGRAKLPIIHFTATFQDADGRARSMAAGANEYIEQPVEPDVLVATIRKIVQEHWLTDPIGDSWSHLPADTDPL